MVRVGYLIRLLFLLLFGIAPAVRRVRRVVIAGEGQSMELNETDQDNNSAFAIEAGIDATRDMQANEDDDTEIKTAMAQGFENLDSFGEQTLRTDEDEEDKTLNDLLKKVSIHLPYYMQLFTPVFHGEDHRLPAKALSQPYPATALSELHQADEEPDEPKSNLSTPIGQSLMQDEERMAQHMTLDEECFECQQFITEIIKGCCSKTTNSDLPVDCNIRICEQGTEERESIKYSDLTKLDVFKERNKFRGMSPNQERFRRLYMDFTALGSILHKARMDLAVAKEVSLRDLCYLYMTETYNCNGPHVARDRIDARMPSSVIPIKKYRNEVCRSVDGGQAWGTKRMCFTDFAEKGDLLKINPRLLGKIRPPKIMKTPRTRQLNPVRAEDSVEDQNLPQVGPGAEGLGFPEIPLVWKADGRWDADDSDDRGFMWSNYRQTAKLYLAVGNKSQKIDKTDVTDMIATMPAPNASGTYTTDTDLEEVWKYWKEEVNVNEKTMSRATAMMKWMSIVLFDFKKKSFSIENIPYFVRKALKIAYKYVDSKGNLRARLKNWAAPSLQNIGYANIAGYENPKEKRHHIEGYIQDYLPDLRDAIDGCTVGAPYYKPKAGKLSGVLRGVEPKTEDHRHCIEEAVENFHDYNAFFARRLKLGRRDYLCYDHDAEKCKKQGEAKSLTFEEEVPIIVSPADSRIILVSVLEESRFWIKGEHFNLKSLVSFDKEEHYTYYQEGRMLISRLAPQDYHRFHFPIDGTVTGFKHYPGAYYSVNPIAIGHEGTPVFHSNKRMHATIRSTQFGCVLYVSVAATNVGSIIHTSYVEQNVIRGMEHGFMQFGGSTVLIIFPKGVADFDENIEAASGVPIETIVQMGAKLGHWTTTNPPGEASPCDDAEEQMK